MKDGNEKGRSVTERYIHLGIERISLRENDTTALNTATNTTS